jgi:MGT family glycosyltransferase
MARYLFYTTAASSGHVFALVPVLGELQRRNHEVVIRAHSALMDMTAELGLTGSPIATAIEQVELDDWRARTRFGALLHILKNFRERAPLEIEDVRQTLEEECPDVLVTDVICCGASVMARHWGGRWAQYTSLLPFFRSRDTPLPGPGFRPMGGALGKIRDRSADFLLCRIYDLLLPPHNELRAQLGVPPLEAGIDVFFQAPLTLAFTAEPFDYPRSDWPPSLRLVGPGVSGPQTPAPRWLEEIDDPILLVALSTEYQADGRLLEVALKAFANQDVYVVGTTGAVDPVGFEVPDNARVERYLPHGPILKRSACVISPGGMGLTQRALAAGVPLCVVPFGRDQPEVARRVEMAKAGKRLPLRRLVAVQEAIAMKPGAERVADAFAAIDTGRVGADALEECLADGPQRPSGSHGQVETQL